MEIDIIDRKLLDLMQAEFPLTWKPYSDLGLKLDIAENNVIERIAQLEAKRIIRQIGPVLDARRLGYQSTLAAMRVADSQIEKAEQVIREHPGVSHGYERNHHFNIWFTLTVPPGTDMETELKRMTDPINAEAVFALPALKLFKIRVYFAMGEGSQAPVDEETPSDGALPQKTGLSALDRAIINELQQNLPLIPEPFTAMAEVAGVNPESFLSRCRSLKERGILRRFGASINHNRAGFKANAMTCWTAPPEAVDTAGQKLASLHEVSHCYERKTNPLWRYNLFAMIHAHTRETCQEIARRASDDTGLTDCVMLFSTREFKKTRTKYLV